MTPGRKVEGSELRVQCPRVRHRWKKYLSAHGCTFLNPAPLRIDERGFTFIEIMIVLVVIGILLSLAQPSFSTSVHRAREATLQEDLFIFRDVIDQYYADHEEYPPTLEAIVEARYLRKIPKDPMTGSDTTWILVYITNEEGEEQGIFDVKSGSDQVGLDGTAHSDW